MSPDDYWIPLTSTDGRLTWHRYRHMPSGAGGTYGWWRVCGDAAQGPFCGHRREETADAPPKGERVCRRCKKGVAKWEETGTAGDWIGAVFGVQP